jgi:hypothetical protein
MDIALTLTNDMKLGSGRYFTMLMFLFEPSAPTWWRW